MNTTNKQQATLHTVFPIILLVIGLFLVMFKIYADSEPGALPLFLLLVGTVWLIVTRAKRKHKTIIFKK
jgi:cytochrome c-type biogenesis protein CcmH/NrfF